MTKINYIFLIQTPFHVESMSYIYKSVFYNKESLIICHERIEIQKENVINYGDEFLFSINSTFKNGFFDTRKKIKQLGEYIDEILHDNNISEDVKVIAGTDREIFNQLIFKKLKFKFNPEFILVEEGTGFYSKQKIADKPLKYLYRIIGNLFFGFKIEYVRPLGSHPYINKIYLRDVDKIDELRSDVTYLEYKFQTKKLDLKGLNQTLNILFFSFPNQDYGIKPSVKLKFFSTVLDYMKKKEGKIFIKPHPRELIADFEILSDNYSNYTILDNKIIGEKIPFSAFDMIFHFNSSVAFEIINSGFDQTKIYSIDPKNIQNTKWVLEKLSEYGGK